MLGAGSSLDAIYPLPGPVAAGTWAVSVSGKGPYRVDLLYRDGEGDHAIGQTDMPSPGTIQGVAAPARCGDLLVLRVRNLGTDISEVDLSLKFP
jgi:hypothetical protein